eukprot:12922688-Prorocentrum_lima.AAC.1
MGRPGRRRRCASGRWLVVWGLLLVRGSCARQSEVRGHPPFTLETPGKASKGAWRSSVLFVARHFVGGRR